MLSSRDEALYDRPLLTVRKQILARTADSPGACFLWSFASLCAKATTGSAYEHRSDIGAGRPNVGSSIGTFA